MQFNIDMMIKDLVDAKIREEKDLRRKRRRGQKKRGGQNTSALNSEVGDSPAMTERKYEREGAKGKDQEIEEDEDEEKQSLTENMIAMQRVGQQAIESVSNS